MAKDSEIVTWLNGRPSWTQEAVRRIHKNGFLSPADENELADLCKKAAPVGTKLTDEVLRFVITSDMLTLSSIAEPKGIDELNPKKPLQLHDKLTIVYGTNGSGKSGYIRILKQVCGGRMARKLVGSVFVASPPPQSCKIGYSHNGTAQEILASSGKSAGRNRGSSTNDRSAEAIDPEDPLLRIMLDSSGTSENEVDSFANTEGTSEAYRPILGQEMSSLSYRPLEEQLYLAMATLFEQEQRHCVVRTQKMTRPVSIVAPKVNERYVLEEDFQKYLEKVLRKTNISHPVEEVRRQIARREKRLQKIDAPSIDEEPISAKRTILSNKRKSS